MGNMGCTDCRNETEYKNVFVTWDEYTKLKDEKKFVPLDCSIDTKNVKADDNFKKHRMAGAQQFNLSSYCVGKPPVHTTPKLDDIDEVLKKVGVGKDTNVLCYDAEDGIFACRAAVLLKAWGVKSV
jgi:3-mercaptopyruvate sulfurtransferase SseA